MPVFGPNRGDVDALVAGYDALVELLERRIEELEAERHEAQEPAVEAAGLGGRGCGGRGTLAARRGPARGPRRGRVRPLAGGGVRVGRRCHGP